MSQLRSPCQGDGKVLLPNSVKPPDLRAVRQPSPSPCHPVFKKGVPEPTGGLLNQGPRMKEYPSPGGPLSGCHPASSVWDPHRPQTASASSPFPSPNKECKH